MLFTKHIHVLHLLSTIPAPIVTEVNGQIRRLPSVTEDQANTAWDILFDYIHAHWQKPLSSGDRLNITRTVAMQTEGFDCRAMLMMNTKEFQEKLATLPPYFTEVVFPIAVARYLLRELCLPLHHRKIRTFKEFHDRYGYMILMD